MTSLNLDTPVGQWVAERPSTSRVFEALRIDYCCGGGVPLRDACAARQLDPQSVLDQLGSSQPDNDDAELADHWTEAPLTSLCDHIEQTHHAYLRSELPRLQTMIDKVCFAHGAGHPELERVRRAFSALQSELGPHMFKEEQILFPAIRRLEKSETPPSFAFGSVGNPIRVMEHEHDQAGDALAQIREATDDFRVPQDACNTYRAMLDGLAELERNMHQHVHKENNILFPRAMKLERLATA